MVLHKDKRIERPGRTIHTTLCGRMNSACADGMNIADADNQVTCKFCLKKMAAARASKAEG